MSRSRIILNGYRNQPEPYLEELFSEIALTPRPAPGAFPRSGEFSKNAENLASIVRISNQLDRLHKIAIRRGSQPEIAAMTETQYLYLGIEAEARLRKIISDPTGFEQSDRDTIRSSTSQISRWIKAVELSFGRHYEAWEQNKLNKNKLPYEVRLKYDSIYRMLNVDLRPVIENRNKIAHGQPLWQLKSMSDFEFKSTSSPLEYGDYWSLKHRRLMLQAIGDVVLVLVVSLPTFDRDFQKYLTTFDKARSEIIANSDGSQYQNFIASLSKQNYSSRPSS